MVPCIPFSTASRAKIGGAPFPNALVVSNFHEKEDGKRKDPKDDVGDKTVEPHKCTRVCVGTINGDLRIYRISYRSSLPSDSKFSKKLAVNENQLSLEYVCSGLGPIVAVSVGPDTSSERILLVLTTHGYLHVFDLSDNHVESSRSSSTHEENSSARSSPKTRAGRYAWGSRGPLGGRSSFRMGTTEVKAKKISPQASLQCPLSAFAISVQANPLTKGQMILAIGGADKTVHLFSLHSEQLSTQTLSSENKNAGTSSQNSASAHKRVWKLQKLRQYRVPSEVISLAMTLAQDTEGLPRANSGKRLAGLEITSSLAAGDVMGEEEENSDNQRPVLETKATSGAPIEFGNPVATGLKVPCGNTHSGELGRLKRQMEKYKSMFTVVHRAGLPRTPNSSKRLRKTSQSSESLMSTLKYPHPRIFTGLESMCTLISCNGHIDTVSVDDRLVTGNRHMMKSGHSENLGHEATAPMLFSASAQGGQMGVLVAAERGEGKGRVAVCVSSTGVLRVFKESPNITKSSKATARKRTFPQLPSWNFEDAKATGRKRREAPLIWRFGDEIVGLRWIGSGGTSQFLQRHATLAVCTRSGRVHLLSLPTREQESERSLGSGRLDVVDLGEDVASFSSWESPNGVGLAVVTCSWDIVLVHDIKAPPSYTRNLSARLAKDALAVEQAKSVLSLYTFDTLVADARASNPTNSSKTPRKKHRETEEEVIIRTVLSASDGVSVRRLRAYRDNLRKELAELSA